MNVGLPGTGLAGLFYLLTALWMPCHELVRTLRGERDRARWRLALPQAALAIGIIAAIAATTWVVGIFLAARIGPAIVADDQEGTVTTAAPIVSHFLGVAPTAAAFTALAVVVLLVEVVGLVVALARHRETPGAG